MARIVPIILLSLLLALSAVAAQDDLQDETILLTYIPNIQFAPFYVGIYDGYFAKAGFTVKLEHLQEPEVLDLVAAGQADFGIVSGEQVILARSQGRDVVYVFEWFQQYPVGIVIAGGDGISSLDGLRGTKVGIPGRFGASYSGLTALLKSAGLSESDVEIDEIGFNASEVLCVGAVKSAVVYVNNEPLQIENRIAANDCAGLTSIEVVTVASQVDLVSNGLIVNADILRSDAAKVGRMVAAIEQAVQASINNPARAYLASLQFVDNLPISEQMFTRLQELSAAQADFLQTNPDREQIAASREEMNEQLGESVGGDSLTQFAVLLRTIDLWDADTLGYTDLLSWESMHETLQMMGFLDDQHLDLEESFSNQFVSGVDV